MVHAILSDLKASDANLPFKAIQFVKLIFVNGLDDLMQKRGLGMSCGRLNYVHLQNSVDFFKDRVFQVDWRLLLLPVSEKWQFAPHQAARRFDLIHEVHEVGHQEEDEQVEQHIEGTDYLRLPEAVDHHADVQVVDKDQAAKVADL